MTSLKTRIAAGVGLALTSLSVAFGMAAAANAAPAITPAVSIVAMPGSQTSASASFNHAAPAREWMNQCVEEVPQSNWGIVYQTNTDTGQVISTGIQCDPYGPAPTWVPAPN